MHSRTPNDIIEFGDFQTPEPLAQEVCAFLKRTGIEPTCVLEPTCGRGSFLVAATEHFEKAHLVGVDINPKHIDAARNRLLREVSSGRVDLMVGDFYALDWGPTIRSCPGSWLIVGNPPWVINAGLGALESVNLPVKSNFHGRRGIDALTGMGNFDISEWMVLRYLDWMKEKEGWIAVLLKTSVARKIFFQARRNGYPLGSASIYMIDASKHFGVSVDACLLVLSTSPTANDSECKVFSDLGDVTPAQTLGLEDGLLVTNHDAYVKLKHLMSKDRSYTWRSGIKHDCAKVMELFLRDGNYRNGLGEIVDIEEDFLYPLFKSSDVARGAANRDGFMLVTQRNPNDDTRLIEHQAPQTWMYLLQHASYFEKRGSSVYQRRPSFSIFGVGEYTFAPWKVAISGLYKKLAFRVVGPANGRPVVFDDTVYYLSCQSQAEAEFLAKLLNSTSARAFYESMIFWSDKRPITAGLLNRLSITKLAKDQGRLPELDAHRHRSSPVTLQLDLL